MEVGGRLRRVIIISSEADGHAVRVVEELRRLDQPVTLLDLSDFPLHSQLSMYYASERDGEFTLETPSGAINFADVVSIWWRRPQNFRLDSSLRYGPAIQFALNESHEAISGLWHALDDVFWINDPARDATAQRKAYQLRVARNLGLPIPETLITNNPEAARLFIERGGDIICKAFSATEANWRETRLVLTEEMANLEAVRFAPVIFQKYVEAVFDLRITVVGSAIFAAAIHSQETAYAVDCRIDIGRARIEAVTLPELVQTQLHRLMDQLGLVYGAIDMRLHPDGRYVFLEVNPAGQFLFIEDATKQPIAQAIAATLARGEASALGRSDPAALL